MGTLQHCLSVKRVVRQPEKGRCVSCIDAPLRKQHNAGMCEAIFAWPPERWRQRQTNGESGYVGSDASSTVPTVWSPAEIADTTRLRPMAFAE